MSKLKYYDGTEWKTVDGQITGDTLPIGSIIPYGSTTAPVNWLVCDGSAVSRTTYADLFNIIGTSFGSGDGSTTFNLPNLKGKVPVGIDSTQTEFDTIGETGGSKELQEHYHTIGNRAGAGSTSAWGIPSEYNTNMGSFNTGSAGYGNSGNLQPYQVVCYIIKVSQSSGLIANVSNTQSDSQTDTYSCDYINTYVQEMIQGTVLWTNSNPTNSFGNQTVQFNAGDYDKFEVVCRLSTSNDLRVCHTVYKGSTYRLTEVGYETNDNAFVRDITITSTGASISSGMGYGIGSNSSFTATNNNALIPLEIRGFKVYIS